MKRVTLIVLLSALAASVALAKPESELFELPRPDLARTRQDDADRVLQGGVPHFAVARTVDVTPWSAGRWTVLDETTVRWKLRLRSPGASSLSLAFAAVRLPAGAELTIASARQRLQPLTRRDAHGELWTPPLAGDELSLVLDVSAGRLDELELHLTRVHHGYAALGGSGDCQGPLSEPAAEVWREAARSVGLITVEGIGYCTGFLVNNTALDGRPLFLTAHHCGVDRANAHSLVVIWNHDRGDAPVQFQSGAVQRAASVAYDFTLLELDQRPDPRLGPVYAGWDRSTGNPTSVAAVHHPGAGIKSLALAGAVSTTAHLTDAPWPGGNHLRVVWEHGSTEGGSSGAPLFDQNQRVVGLLHGGYAACGNHRPDWFSRLSTAWKGNGRPDSRLQDWLDPLGSGAVVLDELRPQ